MLVYCVCVFVNIKIRNGPADSFDVTENEWRSGGVRSSFSREVFNFDSALTGAKIGVARVCVRK